TRSHPGRRARTQVTTSVPARDPECGRHRCVRAAQAPDRTSGSRAGQHVGEAEVDGPLELRVGARPGLAVGSPPDELGGVPEAHALHVVVADLAAAFGTQRYERQFLPRVPAAELVLARSALPLLVGRPVPRVAL